MRGSSLLRFLLLALVVGVLAVAAGCGGGSDDSASADDEPDVTETTTETAEEEETTTEEEETTMQDEESSEDEGASEDTDLSGVASAEDCEDLADLSRALGEAIAGQDIDVDRYSTFLTEFADRTPEEIRPDFQVLAEAWETYAKVIEDLNLEDNATPSLEDITELQQAFAGLDQEAITEASTNIGEWAQENCRP